jgi:hypothetical protein
MAANELRWERVPDHQRFSFFAGRDGELILPRKALQERRFAQGDCAILDGMEEASLRWVVAAARDRRGNVIPRHPAIDVVKAVLSLVAPKLALVGKVAPAATVFGEVSDQLADVRGAVLRNIVKSRPRSSRQL